MHGQNPPCICLQQIAALGLMKRIFKYVVYTFALVGFMYAALMAYFWLMPPGKNISTRGGICEEKVLSSKYSPNKNLNAAHIVEVCSGGLVQHKFVIANGSEDVKRSDNNQIIHSTEIEKLNILTTSVAPIDIKWRSNTAISLKVEKGLENVFVPELAGVAIYVSPK